MASSTRWTWVWVDSGSWWWTGRPGVLQFMGSQRVRHDWATELNWTESNVESTPYVNVCNPIVSRREGRAQACGMASGLVSAFLREAQWQEKTSPGWSPGLLPIMNSVVWAGYLILLSLSFLICKLGTMMSVSGSCKGITWEAVGSTFNFSNQVIRSLFLPHEFAKPSCPMGILVQMVCWVTGLGSFQPSPCHSLPEVTPLATPPYNVLLYGPRLGVGNHHPCNILHPHFFALKSFHSASCIERNRLCSQSIRGEQETQDLNEQSGLFSSFEKWAWTCLLPAGSHWRNQVD